MRISDWSSDVCSSDLQHLARMARARAFEIRSYRPSASAQATQHYQWFRVAAPIGDDPLVHRGFLAFASDMGLLSSAMLPHGVSFWTPGLVSTSLDHAMWFHGDVRVDQWLDRKSTRLNSSY